MTEKAERRFVQIENQITKNCYDLVISVPNLMYLCMLLQVQHNTRTNQTAAIHRNQNEIMTQTIQWNTKRLTEGIIHQRKMQTGMQTIFLWFHMKMSTLDCAEFEMRTCEMRSGMWL